MVLAPVMIHVSARTMKRLTLAAVLGAAVLGVAVFGAPASNAAELGVAPGARHIRHVERYWNWRDRCAYAGYYCLYAEYGFVYAYPFDDRPIASAYYARRHRHRY